MFLGSLGKLLVSCAVVAVVLVLTMQSPHNAAPGTVARWQGALVLGVGLEGGLVLGLRVVR